MEQLSRQQLYDRIRAAFSKDAFILEEMKRLGFWDNSPQPTLSEELIKKEATLQKELQELLEKQQQYNNREAMLREMRAAKLQVSKEKQAATKLRNEQKRKEKAEKWLNTEAEQVVYLGEKVSAGLAATESNKELLQKNNLPVFDSVKELATQMGLSLTQLRFLAYHRKVSTICHYHYFSIPKKSGGRRQLAAPKKQLKAAQHWILENILYKIPTHQAVHGFTPQHSIQTNAMPHVGKAVVINLDLKDFFPSISQKRIKGLFTKLGYAEQQATVLSLLCSHAEIEKFEVDGQLYYVQKGERFLPQGSPASPALTNWIAYKLDLRLEGLAKKYGFTYTRYADDLTFSATEIDEKKITALLAYVEQVVESEGFTLHPDKTHVMRTGSQQKVTGIVVNEKTNIDRKTLHSFRALLHQIDKTGWEGKQWGNSPNIIASVIGFANFVNMVNPTKGQVFKAEIAALLQKYPPTADLVTTKKLQLTPQNNSVATTNVATILTKPIDNQADTNKSWWDIFNG